MLATARARSSRAAGLPARIALARRPTPRCFDPQALFGVAAFDRVFISYALSMIPPWQRAADEAAATARPRRRLAHRRFRRPGRPAALVSARCSRLARAILRDAAARTGGRVAEVGRGPRNEPRFSAALSPLRLSRRLARSRLRETRKLPGRGPSMRGLTRSDPWRWLSRDRPPIAPTAPEEMRSLCARPPRRHRAERY